MLPLSRKVRVIRQLIHPILGLIGPLPRNVWGLPDTKALPGERARMAWLCCAPVIIGSSLGRVVAQGCKILGVGGIEVIWILDCRTPKSEPPFPPVPLSLRRLSLAL